jgi:hypothetical protein
MVRDRAAVAEPVVPPVVMGVMDQAALTVLAEGLVLALTTLIVVLQHLGRLVLFGPEILVVTLAELN